MDIPKVFDSEYRFCPILWEHSPIASKELVQLCQKQLGWKPTTTYTVIKRLSERGILKNEHTLVTALVTKEQVQTAEIDELVHNRFADSLPAFVAAFTRSRNVTDQELDEVQEMINRYRKEQSHG